MISSDKNLTLELTVEEWIKFYRRLGLAPIPAIYGDKRPEVDWKPYQERKPTDREIGAWFNDGAKHNIALVCGAVSDNLVVLDFDDVNIYERFFDTTKLEAEFPVVKTGGGKRHVWTRTPKPIPSFKIPQIRLEVRSTGNIVIVPPSLHPSGNHYEFVNPEIKEIPTVEDLAQVIWGTAEAKFNVRKPAFLPREVEGYEKKCGEVWGKPYRGPHPPCIKKLLDGVAASHKGYGAVSPETHGCSFAGRNFATMALASYFLFTRDLEPAHVRRRLLEWNKLNRPPQSERKVVITLNEVLHRGYQFGCQGLAALCDRENCALVKNEGDPAPWFAHRGRSCARVASGW